MCNNITEKITKPVEEKMMEWSDYSICDRYTVIHKTWIWNVQSQKNTYGLKVCPMISQLASDEITRI